MEPIIDLVIEHIGDKYQQEINELKQKLEKITNACWELNIVIENCSNCDNSIRVTNTKCGDDRFINCSMFYRCDFCDNGLSLCDKCIDEQGYIICGDCDQVECTKCYKFNPEHWGDHTCN